MIIKTFQICIFKVLFCNENTFISIFSTSSLGSYLSFCLQKTQKDLKFSENEWPDTVLKIGEITQNHIKFQCYFSVPFEIATCFCFVK